MVLLPEISDLLGDTGAFELVFHPFLSPVSLLKCTIENVGVKITESPQSIQRYLIELPKALQKISVKNDAQILPILQEPKVPQIGSQFLLIESVLLGIPDLEG